MPGSQDIVKRPRWLVEPPRELPAPATYGLAVLVTLAVFAIQHALVPLVTLVPFLLMFLAVFLASWVGGRGPGFVAIALSAVLADYHFLPPVNAWSLDGRSLLLVGIFLLCSSVVNLLGGALRDALTQSREQASRTQYLLDVNRGITENAAEAIFVTDRAGVATFANREAERLFGFPLAELRGRVLHDLVHHHRPDGAPFPADECPLASTSRDGGTVRSFEGTFFRKDGTPLTVECSAAPLDVGGDRVGSVLVARDVTEQRRIEGALRESDRRKDEFLALLSHELRNPLAPIRNSLYIAHRAPPDSDAAARSLRVIDRQVTHLTRLVDDLLDVTRISRGKIRLQPVALDLCELLRRAVDDHRPDFQSRGVRLEYRSCAAPTVVRADPVRLEQILGNLLSNAAKFTPAGGTTSVEVETGDDGFARLRVRDTGAGIVPEILPRVFEAFVQADTTLDRSRGGLGLGLALVKGLAELHGGSASAHSDGPGLGAEFVVRLPLGTADEGRADPGPAAGPQPRARRVLVVEDNRDAADTLKEALELAGFEVAVAYDGYAGLAAARTYRPDAVLCDIGLPGLDGYGVARALRQDPELAATFLVALTGYAQEKDRERALEAGFDAHAAKPPDLEALQRLVARGRAPAGEGEALAATRH